MNSRAQDIVVSVIACSSALCCSSGTSEIYNILLEIDGSRAAFAGRTLEIHGKPTRQGPIQSIQNPESLTLSSNLCTFDHQRFLSEPITIVVRESDAVVSTNVVQRVACKLSLESNANTEWDTVYLEDSGTIAADFGNDPRIVASCTLSTSFGPNCEYPF